MAKKTTPPTSTPASAPKTPAPKKTASGEGKKSTPKAPKAPKEKKPRKAKERKVCPEGFVAPANAKKGQCPYCHNFMKTTPSAVCKRCGYKVPAVEGQTSLPSLGEGEGKAAVTALAPLVEKAFSDGFHQTPAA